MQKLLAYLVLLLLPLAARGQALSKWYYWFDTDKVPQQSGQVSDQKFHLEADVSDLSIGVHTLYVQVADTAGVFSPPVGTWFYHVPDTENMDKLYYWFSGEDGMHSVDFGDGKIELDVSSIPTGLHSLNVQVMDRKGSVSGVNTYLFYKVPASAKVEKLRYWIDGSQDIKEMAYGQSNFLLDVSECVPGFHFLHYYVIDADGRSSSIQSAGFYRMPMESAQKLYYWFTGDSQATEVEDFANGFVADVTHVQEGFNTMYTQIVDHGPTNIEAHHFIKVAQTEGNGDLTVACIIDGEIVAEEKVPCQGGVIKLDMDVSNIEVGLHKAMFQVITPTGAGSSIAETYFIRTLTNDDVASMQCSYTIDGFKHYTQKGTMTNGAFHFDLPVDEVEDGLHRIDFMLVAENGATTTQGSSWFIKTPLGGNAVTQYDYWLNDKTDEVQRVTLDNPTDPFQLIKLLPVSSEPLRSSCFHFEAKDGVPMMYAKNDIHFRFHDRTGRWVDESKQYVDYNTSAAVTDVTELKSSQTFARLDDNNIKWFKFEAAPGDTIGFKSSQATTLQVFAPSGKEILSAMGDKSVQYSGAHTWEEGVHYLAVHDVTGSKSDITLDYMHMDKYDVVSQDVYVVGNGGCSTITYQGNGFRDLVSVDLVNADGDVVSSIDVGHESDAETTVTFDFTDVELGIYDALFHFTTEDKTFANNITVEPPVDIELATKVTYPSTFLRGTSVTYTVEITNKGNMTAYAVPLYTWIQSNTKESIESINIEGLGLKRLVDFVDKDSCTTEVYAAIEEYSQSISDDHYFMKFKTLNADNPSDSVVVRSCYFTTQLAPNEKKKIQFTIKSAEIIQAYFTVPSDWYSVYTEGQTNRQRARFKSKQAMASYCCYREQVECVANITVDVFDFASLFGGPLVGLTDCVVGALSQMLSAAGDVACGKNDVGTELAKKANAVAKGMSIAGSLLSCASGYNKLKNVTQLLSALVQTGDMILYPKVGVDCVTAFREKKPNCPPAPPGGGSSSPRNSCEPNDIRGYTSESGSLHMRNDIEDVMFIIDSENDPVFADAPAHTVIITDTINSLYYDTSYFCTTNVTIGDVSMDLDGTEQNFIKTMDLRPRINVIAQVEQKYDPQTGIAKWIWTSLDPMTMEPTDDVMQGVLPVNDESHIGEGHITYHLKQKKGLPDGTEVTNQADIIFDSNDPVFTPVWTNTIDAVAPTGHVVAAKQKDYETATLTVEGIDERSGVWAYDVYVQYGTKAEWLKVAEKVSPREDGTLDVKVYEGINHGFYVCAVDSAGNVEVKEPLCEVRLDLTDMISGDANGDGSVSVGDMTTVISALKGESPEGYDENGADANHDGIISVEDLQAIIRRILRK